MLKGTLFGYPVHKLITNITFGVNSTIMSRQQHIGCYPLMNNLFLPIIKTIDTINEYVGRFTAWLVLILVFLICYDVVMRYLFHQGSVALQELEWHLFALIFLLGAAYTYKHDAHVRVDLIYNSSHISDKQRIWINIIGNVLFLFPFCLLVFITSWPFVENAFFYNEGSPDPGGLPYRFILKGSLLVAFGLLMLQGVAELLRNLIKLPEAK